ncbi:hypothetical protein GFS31_12200 [Leptolyngbya sp. BL0902]|nr:hypothetical protein GFS31_12200 [Leptolyngbya sp. BL0902]
MPAQAQPAIIETGGTIVPAESVHTFEGQAGQVVTITLESEDFDPVLTLQNAAGEEIAFNDDFGGSLNSRIVAELPASGTYRVVARSYSGNGGDFSLTVRLATEFEMALAKADSLTNEGRYSDAIAAYTAAIALDPNQAISYLGRAQATLSQVYMDQGETMEGPEDIPAAARQSMITDFETAADLLEADGDINWAMSLREQAAFLQGGGEGN